jgi:putative ABC transport system permease protein
VLAGAIAAQRASRQYDTVILRVLGASGRQLLLLVDGTVAALMVTGDATVLTVARRNLDAILARG